MTAEAMPTQVAPASERRGRSMVTFTGRLVWPVDARAADVCIEDIAHHLALANRWAGATYKPYSVAQHSVLVSRHCASDHALIGLLHDAAEAYTGDVPAPLKVALWAGCDFVERNWNVAIAEALGLASHELLEAHLPNDVVIADLMVREAEARDLVADFPRAEAPAISERIEPWEWREAEEAFLHRFVELTPGLHR